MFGWIRKVLRSEKGQGMAEYALLLVLIAVACIAITRTLGGNIQTKLQEISNGIIGAK